MKKLKLIFLLKIIFTLLLWSGPLLLLPQSILMKLGFPFIFPNVFLKLLGWAYLALVVGYGFGLNDSINGHYPISAIWVGVVSNGGASLLILIYGIQGSWEAWGNLAQLYMWLSFFITGSIFIALIWFGLVQRPLQYQDSL